MIGMEGMTSIALQTQDKEICKETLKFIIEKLPEERQTYGVVEGIIQRLKIELRYLKLRL